MSKKSAQETWLTPEAMDILSHVWQERIALIIEDLADWPHMNYAFAINNDGVKLTYKIGPGGTVVNEDAYPTEVFHHLANTVEEYLMNIEHPADAQVTIELENELLFVASTGEIYLVASFKGIVERGYLGMKLKKRIAHLKSLSAQQQKGRIG